MNRRIISITVAAAMLCSQAVQAVSVFANDAGYTCGFSNASDTLAYSLYDAANDEGIITYDADNQRLCASFGDDHQWEENNGVKTDVTKTLENCGADDKVKVSAEFTSTYWNDPIGKAKMFLEVVNTSGTSQVIIYEGPESTSSPDETVTLSGETGEYSYSAGDTVYLCITQGSGMHYYDDISLSVEKQGASAVPTREPDEGELFYDDFSDGSTAGYTLYDSANTGADIAAEESLNVNFGAKPYDWNENNGVRKDITELAETESKYSVSADVYSSWWGGVTAKVFFEIEGTNGTRTTIDIAENKLEDYYGTVTVSGTADLRFSDGEKVYLCITQAAGYQSYDNIKMVYVGKVDPAPTETEVPEPTLAPAEDAIFNDDFLSEEQAENYSLYDRSNTTAGAGISLDNGELAASMGTVSWNPSNGIRREITELVKQYISGVTFGIQFSITAYWGESNDVSANVFFETIGADGSTSVTEIGSVVPEAGSDTAVMRGSAKLSYKDGDRIYLCVTQMSGNHRYDNISMWLENPNEEGVVPLTSGTRYTGTYFPENAKAIFKNSFAGSAAVEMENYSPYNDVAYVIAEPRDGGAFFEFPEGGASTRGVTVDITDAIENNIPNGGQVRISCKMLPWWWWGSASIKLRIGEKISDVAIYTSNSGDPGGKWATIGEIVELEHTPGEKVELIITMDSSSATGITIDDVCVELPYNDITARDIAVSDISKLDGIDKVSIVYGGEFITETNVSWDEPEAGANEVYGTTDIAGVTARAVITDSAVKVRVAPDGVVAEETALEYGKAVTAGGNDELVFLLDSLDSMNLISSVAGAAPAEGMPETSAKMIVRDNGNGITVEGIAAEAADNDKIILIKNSSGEIAGAVYARLGSDGGYCASMGALLPRGSYTAVMTDTGISTTFSYATADEFEKLRAEINSGSAAEILENEANRIILGAMTYEQLDKLSSGDKADVYNEFKSEIGNKTRAEAAELFDALVTIKSASSAVSESEWTEMIERSASALGIKNMPIYDQYMEMSSSERSSAKDKTYSLGADTPEEFVEAFSGAVLNTRLMNARQYSNIQSILKENAVLFEGAGVDVNSISTNEAKYIINNISSGDTTIDAIVSLIEEAEKNASSSTGGNGGSGIGTGSYGSSSGSNTVPGSSIGLNINTQPGEIENGVTFIDLSDYGWAETAVYYLADRQVINGYGDGTFRPGENVTREAFVKMLVAVLDIPMNGSSVTFEDVPADRWSYSYVSAAAANGIVTGVSETEFAPDASITRQDAAVMIYRALQYKGISIDAGELSFTDSDSVSDYAGEAVAALSGNGVINGMDDGSFAPTRVTNRAQAAVMLYRVADMLI